MVTADLQGLVDALAAELGRPVGVDDRGFHALAYSSHVDGIDPVRVASILQREAPREVTVWLESLGIAASDAPVRVPANPSFGMAARVCVPIRFARTLLAYLWLIDEPEPLTESEVAAAVCGAEELAAVIYRLRHLEHDDRERERALLRALADPVSGKQAEEAARELLCEGFLAPANAYAALVVQSFRADGAPLPEEVRIRQAAAAERVRRTIAPRHLLILVHGDSVLVLLALTEGDELDRRGAALLESVERNLADTPEWSALVGAGGESDSVAVLPSSFLEARRALAVARRVPEMGPLARWSRLGSYRMIATMLGAAAPPPPSGALARLLASVDAGTLVPTLEAYLDLAGDARAAAGRLYVHRSSLYGRLRRIEEIAGVDLRSGDDRLELHLGLRLWRLGGGRFSR